MTPYGLGCLPSPPDERDYPIEQLYDELGIKPPDTLPQRYRAPWPMPEVLDQGSSPMCVAYSTAALKAWQDWRDQHQRFHFDEALFFRRIGGSIHGAYLREAMKELRRTGYPTNHGNADRHRIAAYYRIEQDRQHLCRSIRALGPIVIGTDWAQSWFYPGRGGRLPAFDHAIGGHAIMAVGWNTYGLRIRNSWGRDWGYRGEATIPWNEIHRLHDAWKTKDEKVK